MQPLPSNLTQQELTNAVAKNYPLYLSKVKDGVRFKLRINLTQEQVTELVHDVVASMLERHEKGLITFESEEKSTGYVLFGAWCNYRAQAQKASNHVKRERGIVHDGENQHLIPKAVKSHFDVYQYDDWAGTEGGISTAERTEQDYRDDYYAELYTLLFTYLDDCVADEFFKFDEVNIYKQYILNDWTMKKLVANSNFKRAYVRSGMRPAPAHPANDAAAWRLLSAP
ncbi:hypothetical protein [Hymenobacter terricola]|uniref:hypothetical protein n=1 Tax=Hymenobacter terricola TaxID=2819236 RepID=UPI001B31356E|nr:hypothetical protein [Hymenobacter terricola]